MRARIAASIVLVVGVMLSASACGFVTPVATGEDYAPSDGVSVTVGNVKVLNALILSEDGDEGNLVASIVNNGSERVSVAFQFESDSGKVTTTVSVGAKSTKSIGTDSTFLLEGMNTQPGALLPVFVQHGDETGKQALVPVLDGSQSEYRNLLP